MNHKHRTAAIVVAAFIATAPAMAAGPAAPARAASAVEDQQLAEAYLGWMRGVFAVPDTPDIDAPLRAAMKAIVEHHLARARTQLPAWIDEEQARGGAALSSASLNRALHNRVVNEIALWRLDSPGPDYDAVLARAILRPGACSLPQRDSYLGQLMTIFQAVPVADRPALLAGERELLARWGTRRPGIAPRPQPSLADEETAEVVRLRSGASAPDVAMPPFLANALFKGESLEPYDVQCALHQWGFARALRRGDGPGKALLAWRYATLYTAENWSPPPPSKARPDPGAYPYVAASWGVDGWVDVRVTTDAEGRFGSAVVANRGLSVPGVRDNPPVAFETLFDEASVATAPQRFRPLPKAASAGTTKNVTLRINWSLQ